MRIKTELLILFTVFILTPLVEIGLLVYVGTILGVVDTIIIVLVTGIIGASLARWQGFATLRKIRQSSQIGILPADEIINGALILAGGLLFMAPGLVTDAIGFSLLIPPVRTVVLRWIKNVIKQRIERGNIDYWRLR